MTKNLTKTTNLLAALAPASSRLPRVRGFYRGLRMKDRDGLPDNILVFSRLDGEVLLASAKQGHLHHRHLLIVPLIGRGEVEVDAVRMAVRPGVALWIRPYELHWYPQTDRVLNWLMITFEYGPENPAKSSMSGLRRMTPDAAKILEMVLEWWRASRRREARAEEYAQAMSLALALLLDRLTAQPSAPRRSRRPRSERDDAWLAAVLRRTRDLRQPPAGIDELARLAKMSPSNLRQRFRDYFGVSLGQYVRRSRVHQAMTLIIHRRMRVSEAAEHCGYSSVYSFSRTAKQVLGCSPLQYCQSGGVRRTAPR